MIFSDAEKETQIRAEVRRQEAQGRVERGHEWKAWLALPETARGELLKYARGEVDRTGFTDNLDLAGKALHHRGVFTWDDVDQHREREKLADSAIQAGEALGGHTPALLKRMTDERDWHRSMADRLEKLLPPREP